MSDLPVLGEQTTATTSTVTSLTTGIDAEWFEARQKYFDDQMAKIDEACPATSTDPLIIERRRCALAALDAACPHYMSEGTVISVIENILFPKKGADQ